MFRYFVALSTAAVCTTVLAASTSNPAREQVSSGAPPQQRVRRPPQPPGRLELPAAVLDEAARTGRAHVIVGFDVAFAPEGLLNATDRVQQRTDIAAAQSALESSLSRFQVSNVKRFQVIPALALEVDADALAELARQSGIAYIEPDALERMDLAESSPLIGAPTVWGSGYTGAGQAVAILDTGVERTHPFFGGRVVSEACYSTTSGIFSTAFCTSGTTTTGSGAPCSLAECWHGTHVAGIAAGSGASGGVNFSGVAPGAGIIAIQVFSRINDSATCSPSPAPCALSYNSDQMLGLQRVYALQGTFNVASVNLSLGGATYTTTCDSADNSRHQMFDTLRSVGIAPVVASGNSGRADGLSIPACLSNAVSVGSTQDGSNNTTVDQVSAFSNSASFLSLLAPGEYITSSVTGGAYGTARGTSMATPQVAGAWALLKSRHTSATVDQVLAALQSNGVSITDPRNGVTKSRIAVSAAMAALDCSYSISPSSVTIASAGDSGTVMVTTQTGCAWTATSHAPFVTITSGASGIGSGSVTYTVGKNVGMARSATLTIAARTFSIMQAGEQLPQADFNRDGRLDLAWQHQVDGRISAWLMNGTTSIAGTLLSPSQVADTNWKIAGTGDVDGDGYTDLVWQNIADGRVSAWLMNGLTLREGALLSIPQVADTQWRIRSVGDLDGDGKADLFWQHDGDGRISVWLMNGLTVVDGTLLTPSQVADLNWKIVGTGDFDGNGTRDLVWQNQGDGRLAVWFMTGTSMTSGQAPSIAQVGDLTWKVRGVGDLDGDGHPDLIWQNTADGRISAWLMNGLTVLSGVLLTPSSVADTNWRIVGPR